MERRQLYHFSGEWLKTVMIFAIAAALSASTFANAVLPCILSDGEPESAEYS